MASTSKTSKVAIVMGSKSDWPTMQNTANILDALNISYDAKIVSAHRTPDRLVSFAKGAKDAGYHVIIAGAAALRTCRAWSQR